MYRLMAIAKYNERYVIDPEGSRGTSPRSGGAGLFA
jgi:nitrate reductase beta subunit